jgi:RHS repeat-associated protein
MRRPFALSLAVLLGLGVGTVGASLAPSPGDSSGASSVAQAAYGLFSEPLFAVGAFSADDSAALISALTEYRSQSDPGQTAALERFLGEHPGSAYAVSLWADLGDVYVHQGFFTKALAAWESAWTLGRGLTERQQRARVDYAVGNLLDLHGRLGHDDAVDALIKEIGERQLSGSASENLTGARQTLWGLRHEPRATRRCGIAALQVFMGAFSNPRAARRLDRSLADKDGISLKRLARLSAKAGLRLQAGYRAAGDLPVPSIVHWKQGHYAVLLEKKDDRYRVSDSVLGGEAWISRAAVEQEASGYFLTTASNAARSWRSVPASEAATVLGAGNTSVDETNATAPEDVKNCCSSPTPVSGMPQYAVHSMLVSLNIVDTPVAYTPPKGPAVPVTLTYNQRDANQPATFTYSHLGPKWTFNWMAYIRDDPNSPGNSVLRYVAGGGAWAQSGFNSTTGEFSPEHHDAARLVRTSAAPITYERRLPDGSKEVYGQSDGHTSYPRRVFLTQKIDAQGNAVSLSYDSQLRLITVADALGQPTTFYYEDSADPLRITTIADPFGRTAHVTYDGSGRLASITDAIGMTSTFAYAGTGTFINTMTTPYGATTFSYTESGIQRTMTMTDAKGKVERVEFRHTAPGIPFSETVTPAGMTVFNSYINYRNSFYWDKTAWARSPGDYTKARIQHFEHKTLAPGDYSTTSRVLESVKSPLQNRVWYNYPGQAAGPAYDGTFDQPSKIGRVHADGTTQLTRLAYNAQGNRTQVIDPAGRETNYEYAANGIDLIRIRQKTAAGYDVLGQWTYNSQHLPLTHTDAAGQITSYVYNSAGQLASVTNPKNETTTYNYSATGYLTSIVNPAGQTQASFTYDAVGRVASQTDSEGYVLGYSYDALNRRTGITYPDGSAETFSYDKLDLVTHVDRLNRTTTYAFDSVRNLTSVTDPLNRVLNYDYFENGRLKSLTDAKNNVTQWARDIEGRVTSKTYPGGSVWSFGYDISGRPTTRTDALNQTRQTLYRVDDRLKSINYLNSVNSTPNVAFTDDAYYPRRTSMTDGSGTTSYVYGPVGTLGANQIQTETAPGSNTAIQHSYDELGRMVGRTVGGAAETLSYDNLGRLTSESNPLGSFSYAYLGQTGQPTVELLEGHALRVDWAYQDNAHDRRLLGITHNGDGGAADQSYVSIAETGIVQRTDTPSEVTQNYQYDADDRLAQITRSVPAGKDCPVTPNNPNRPPDATYTKDCGIHNGKTAADSSFNAAQVVVEAVSSLPGVGPAITSISVAGTVKAVQSAANDAVGTVEGLLPNPPPANGPSALNVTYQTYGQDAADNLTGIDEASFAYSASVNSDNQITGTTLNGQAQSFMRDANGNITEDRKHFYQWDAENRLIQVTVKSGGQVSQFLYDGLSRRVRHIEQATTTTQTRYLWCGEQLCQQRDSADAVTARYYAQGEQHLSAITQSLYYAQDHLGSVIATTDSAGNILGTAEYTAYGRTLSQSGTQADFGYAQMYRHGASGLYLTHYRPYDPDTGRWLARDPIGEEGGLNLYAYVDSVGILGGHCNPLSCIDPTGLFVAGTYDRATGQLSMVDLDSFNSAVIQATSGGHPYGDPIPAGTYDIVERAGREGFYRLDKEDATPFDDVDAVTGRSHLRLHHPGRTTGCISADDQPGWDQIDRLIKNTIRTDAVPDNFKPWWKVWPTTPQLLIRYGTLTVR